MLAKTSVSKISENYVQQSFTKFRTVRKAILKTDSTANVSCEFLENFQNCQESVCRGITFKLNNRKFIHSTAQSKALSRALLCFEKYLLYNICRNLQVATLLKSNSWPSFFKGVLKICSVMEELCNGVLFCSTLFFWIAGL